MRHRVTDRKRIKSGSVWTEQDHQTMLSMLSVGCTRRVIGAALGRSEDAVSSRIGKHGLALRRLPRRPSLKVEYPTARVPKQLVIDWYEVGWRVLGIGVTDCVMEWRLDRAPEYPHACKVEASTATAPERVLEVA
ncbi:hypothetical protein [Bradyrhizobium elkanii]|uniref:hypothetical protein n=1 Tax=Bradyrhizobium elkanii TaxID=29448 RepID=UPI00272B8A04|nr:hypothetical protein [Bradyrhizobium elkanii]WLA80346.1 hypothetical protein QNJ99_33920 [Bradyrhizobium elkanii]